MGGYPQQMGMPMGMMPQMFPSFYPMMMPNNLQQSTTPMNIAPGFTQPLQQTPYGTPQYMHPYQAPT